MHIYRGRLIVALLLSSAIYSASASAEVTIGTPTIGGNCYPFGCSYTGTYQQVFGASAFSAPITIDTVTFFPVTGSPLTSNPSSFTLNFYLTSQAVDGLSTNPSANRTSLLSSFGTFVPGTNYSFNGQSFSYDPSLGNLLLDITTSGAPSASNALSYSSASNDAMSNLYRSMGNGTLTSSSNGLVTRFSQANAVPEPSTWAMMLLGFGGVAVSLRRRRNAARLGQIA